MYGGLAGGAERSAAGTAAAAYCKDGAAQEEAIPPPPKIYRSVNCDAQRAPSVPSSYVPSPHSSNGRIKFKVSSLLL